VGHLESGFRMRFGPRSSGQITSAFEAIVSKTHFYRPVYQTFQKFGPRQGRRRHKGKGSVIKDRHDVYELMAELKAPAHLIEHVQLVWEAGAVLLKKCRQLGLDLDYSLVELGIAVHDLGKTVYTDELSGPGTRHEEEGQKILLFRGVSAELARVCVSHGQWERMACSTEELLVALSDKLWKGQRVEALELQVVDRVCGLLNADRWDLFTELDSCFEHIAADGQERLNKSVGT